MDRLEKAVDSLPERMMASFQAMTEKVIEERLNALEREKLAPLSDHVSQQKAVNRLLGAVGAVALSSVAGLVVFLLQGGQ